MTAITQALDPADPAQVAPAAAPRVNARKVIGAAVLLALVAAGAAYGRHWWTAGRFLQNTDDAFVGGEVTAVSTRVPGYIAKVAVTDNQPVRAGDLLVKLDDRDYRAALEKAEGVVAARRAELASLDATRTLQQAVIAQAGAGVTAAAAESTRSRDDVRRYEHLVSRGAVSVQSAQKADAEFRQAEANTDKAQAGLSAAQRQLDVIGTQKLQVAAALAQALAERDLARLNLDYTEIRAPIDGVIGNRHARTGAYANAASQLLVVVPSHGLWVDANFKESQLAHMTPGEPATVEADALPGHHFHGRVASLAPATGAQFSVLPAENATGNFTKIVQRVPVRILLDDADPAVVNLRPGLSVTAVIDTRANEERQP